MALAHTAIISEFHAFEHVLIYCAYVLIFTFFFKFLFKKLEG